jgi:hypothetical protein
MNLVHIFLTGLPSKKANLKYIYDSTISNYLFSSAIKGVSYYIGSKGKSHGKRQDWIKS